MGVGSREQKNKSTLIPTYSCSWEIQGDPARPRVNFGQDGDHLYKEGRGKGWGREFEDRERVEERERVRKRAWKGL